MEIDDDGDGWTECGPDPLDPEDGDCDDTDADINDWQPEICNGLDDDCDGIADWNYTFEQNARPVAVGDYAFDEVSDTGVLTPEPQSAPPPLSGAFLIPADIPSDLKMCAWFDLRIERWLSDTADVPGDGLAFVFMKSAFVSHDSGTTPGQPGGWLGAYDLDGSGAHSAQQGWAIEFDEYGFDGPDNGDDQPPGGGDYYAEPHVGLDRVGPGSLDNAARLFSWDVPDDLDFSDGGTYRVWLLWEPPLPSQFESPQQANFRDVTVMIDGVDLSGTPVRLESWNTLNPYDLDYIPSSGDVVPRDLTVGVTASTWAYVASHVVDNLGLACMPQTEWCIQNPEDCDPCRLGGFVEIEPEP